MTAQHLPAQPPASQTPAGQPPASQTTASQTTTPGVLAPAVDRVLSEFDVALDGLRVVVRGTPVEADTPQQLVRLLAPVVYQVVHAGWDEPATERPRTLRDEAFDELLAAATPHTTTTTHAVVHRRVSQDMVLATVEGLRVLLPEAALTGPPASTPARVPVRIAAARPALSPGFFLVDGSAGTSTGAGAELLRIYVHVASADAAPRVWHRVVSHLEDLAVPFRAKVTSAPSLFPRRDAIVLYLGPSAWHAAPEVADLVAGMPGTAPDTSPFTWPLAPGVGAAWEPLDERPGMSGLSFGEHRSTALTEGIVRHAVRRDGGDRRVTVAESFLDAGIDPLAPGRNLASPPLAAAGFL